MSKEVDGSSALENVCGGAGTTGTNQGSLGASLDTGALVFSDCLRFFRDTPDNNGNRNMIRQDLREFCLPLLNRKPATVQPTAPAAPAAKP